MGYCIDGFVKKQGKTYNEEKKLMENSVCFFCRLSYH